MKKIKLGLFPKVVIAILLGSLLGIIAPDVLVRILKTFNVFFAQILKFIVPLLVLGLVTPVRGESGTRRRENADRRDDYFIRLYGRRRIVFIRLRHDIVPSLSGSRRDCDVRCRREDFRSFH